MDVLPAALSPVPGESGLVSGDLAAVGRATVRAWDLFLDTARTVDPAAPARAKGWTALQVVVHVGAWEESRRLPDILADARPGAYSAARPRRWWWTGCWRRTPTRTCPTALAAVRRGRDEAQAWFSSPDAADEALLVTPSLLGPLPVATLVHATAYQLAVAALDLVPAGARPPGELLELGLAALVDSAGALAARQGVTASLAALTPSLRVGTGARDGSWRTAVLPPGPMTGPGVGPAIEGDVRTILDVTSGRAAAPALYARGDLRVHDLPGLMPMARVMDGVPGLPGGSALRAAVAFMDAVGGILGRLPFGRR